MAAYVITANKHKHVSVCPHTDTHARTRKQEHVPFREVSGRKARTHAKSAGISVLEHLNDAALGCLMSGLHTGRCLNCFVTADIDNKSFKMHDDARELFCAL